MTSPALARTVGGGRMYHWRGEDYPSVTTILGATMPKPALPAWAAKRAAEFAIANRGTVGALIDAGDERAALDLIKGAPWRDRDRAGEIGTAVHAYAEAIANGDTAAIPEEVMPFAPHFLRFLEDWQPEYVETEATVFAPLILDDTGRRIFGGYGGTLDAIAVIRGETWLLDTKTSASGVWPDTALQLAAYHSASFIGRDDGETTAELPYCERFAVLHLRPEGYRLVPLTVGSEQYAQWERLVDSYRYLSGPHKSAVLPDMKAGAAA